MGLYSCVIAVVVYDTWTWVQEHVDIGTNEEFDMGTAKLSEEYS